MNSNPITDQNVLSRDDNKIKIHEFDKSHLIEIKNKRNSLKGYSLQFYLNKDSDIMNKNEEEKIIDDRNNKYKSMEITSNELIDLNNFLNEESTIANSCANKNTDIKNLEEIRDVSADKNRQHDVDDNLEKMYLQTEIYSNFLELDNNNTNNYAKKKVNFCSTIKKVIKPSEKKNNNNYDYNISNKSKKNIKIGSNDVSNKSDVSINNNISKFCENDTETISKEINEVNNKQNKLKSIEFENKNINNRFTDKKQTISGKSNSNKNEKSTNTKLNKNNNPLDPKYKIKNKNPIGNNKENDNKLGDESFKIKKTHHKSSSMSLMSDRSSMNSIKSKLTETSTIDNCNNTSRIIPKKGSILTKNKIHPNINDLKDKSKIKNVDNFNKKNDLQSNKISKTKKNVTPTNKIINNINITIEKNNMSGQIKNSSLKKPITSNMNYNTNSFNLRSNIGKNKIKVAENNHTPSNMKKNNQKETGTSALIKKFDKTTVKISTEISNKNQNKNLIMKKDNKNSSKSTNTSFSLTDHSLTLKSTKSRNNYSTINQTLLNTSKTSRNQDSSKDSSLLKFKTSNQFNKASSMPKNVGLKEIKESRNEISEEVKKSKGTKIDLDKFLLRENDYLERRNKKLAEMQEEFLKKELEQIKEKPSINKDSKKIAERDTNDFYTRVTNFSQKVENKKKEKIEEKSKKESEQFDKFQEKYKGKHVDLKEKYEILVNWQNKKTELLREKQKSELESQIKSCTFKPEIDKNSKKINNIKRSYDTKNGTDEDLVSRLYKEDALKRKHKKEILKNIYTPTFSPMVSHKINYNYNLTSENMFNQMNNSMNINNTTCNTITGFNFGNNNNDQGNICKEGLLYGTSHSNNNVNFLDTIYNNMRKYKSQIKYGPKKNGNSNKNNNISKNHDNSKMNTSYQSYANPEGKNYYKNFFTDATENPKDVGAILKERFQNVFKKYNMN